VGTSRLWRQRLDAERAEAIEGTDDARLPAWKQTRNVLSFFSRGRLRLLALTDRTIKDAADAPAPAGATWLRDGSLLFVPRPGPIKRLLDGRIDDATRLARGDSAHMFPGTVDRGLDFTYVAVRDDGQRVLRLSSGGHETDLGTTSAHGALVDDWLLLVKDNTVLADHREPEGRMAGSDLPLLLNVGTTRQGRGLLVASRDVLLHAPAGDRPLRLVWLDMRGRQLGAVADAGDYWQVRLSPDDRRVAVTTRDPLLGSLDVLTMAVDATSPALRLTTALAADSDPVWSPDARRLLFRTMQRGRPEIVITTASLTPSADTENVARPAKTNGEVPTDWRAGDMLIQRRSSAGFDLVLVNDASGDAQSVADSPFNETDGRWSPDGRWIAFVSDEPGRSDIYVRGSGETASAPQRVSTGGGTHPRWARDGRGLLFLRGSTVMRADMVGGGNRFGPPRPLFEATGLRDFDVAHRSDRLVALIPVQTDPVDAVSVILNWRSLAEAERQRSQKPVPPKF
jgi:hypothetical protein